MTLCVCGVYTRRYHARTPQLVVVDDVLSDAALAGLFEYAKGATIWHEIKDGSMGACATPVFTRPLLSSQSQFYYALLVLIFVTDVLRRTSYVVTR